MKLIIDHEIKVLLLFHLKTGKGKKSSQKKMDITHGDKLNIMWLRIPILLAAKKGKEKAMKGTKFRNKT